MNIRTGLAVVALTIGGTAEAVEVIFAGDSTMAPMRYVYSSEASTRGSWVDETDDYFPNWKNHILNYAEEGTLVVLSARHDNAADRRSRGGAGDGAHHGLGERRTEEGVASAVQELDDLDDDHPGAQSG